MRRATPERSKIEPTSTNIGKASNGYLAMLACMFCGAASSPHHGEAALAAAIATMPPRPSATAIGTPASIRPTNRTTSSVAIILRPPASTSKRRFEVGRRGGAPGPRQACQPACAARTAIATQSGGIATVNHQRGTPRPIEVSAQRISSATVRAEEHGQRERRRSAVAAAATQAQRAAPGALPPS